MIWGELLMQSGGCPPRLHSVIASLPFLGLCLSDGWTCLYAWFFHGRISRFQLQGIASPNPMDFLISSGYVKPYGQNVCYHCSFFDLFIFCNDNYLLSFIFLYIQSQLSGVSILLHKGSASYFLQRNMRLRDSYGQNLRNEYRRAIMKIATTLNHISKSKNDFLF